MKNYSKLIVVSLIVMFEYCSFGEASDCTEVDLADRYKSAHLCGEDCPPTSNGELSNEPIESDIDGELMTRSLCKWKFYTNTCSNRYPNEIQQAVLTNSNDCIGLSDYRTDCLPINGSMTVLYANTDSAGKCQYELRREIFPVGFTCSIMPNL